MPAYRFYRLENAQAEAEATVMILFNDLAAIRRAVSDAFPKGCDVWQEERFVGRFHRAPDGPPDREGRESPD